MATTSSTAIANMALRLAGISRTISSLDPSVDSSEEALACAAFYEVARDECLAAFDWPFARRAGALDLVEEQPETSSADATYQWGYSYRLPAGGLVFRGIRSPLGRTPAADGVVRYLSAADGAGLIYSDEVNAYGVWTALVTDPTVWPAPFVMAVAALLAFYIAPGLKGEDAGRAAERNYAMYERKLGEAKQQAASQGVADTPPESDLITARG